MPAPRRKLSEKVVARDGTKGTITKTIDQGESGPVTYVVTLDNGKDATLGEDEITDAPPEKPAAARKADDAGAVPAEGAKVQDGAAGGQD